MCRGAHCFLPAPWFALCQLWLWLCSECRANQVLLFPAPQFAFSVLTFCHFRDLNQLLIWSAACQSAFGAQGRSLRQEDGGRQGKGTSSPLQ